MERRDNEITDLKRRLSNGIIVGKISKVDAKKARYRVQYGELETDWIPDTQARAGDTVTFEARSVGEQVVIASPSGDLSQGVIIGSIHTGANQAGDTATIHRVKYPDGTVVEYDHESKSYKMTVAQGGAFHLSIGGGASIVGTGTGLKISAPGGIELESESLTHNGKNIGDSHVHGGVMPGGSDTSTPH
jgi:phage baseplate assembly protein V